MADRTTDRGPAESNHVVRRYARFYPDWGKLATPSPGAGSVPRSALIRRLSLSRARIVTVVAPAGYGKTTFLAQWAERDPRPVMWVSLDRSDNDPAVLLGNLALALDRIKPLRREVLVSGRGRHRPSARVSAPTINEAAVAFDSPVLTVLDDVHLLTDAASLRATLMLTSRFPAGSQLAIAGRSVSPLPMARLRAGRQLLELGVEELRMSPREAAALVRLAGLGLTDEEAAELVTRVEGWPAGLYLATLSARGQRSPAAVVRRFSGRDRWMVDYFRSEVLGPLPPRTVDFLTRTAILERMSGPLCDAVLDTAGSAAVLESLEQAGRLLLPLDRTRSWYRYQRPFREMLQAELRLHQPELEPELHVRAAVWFEDHGDLDEALEHAHRADDGERAARLAATLTLPLLERGEQQRARLLLDRFDDDAAASYPPLMLAKAWLHTALGEPKALNWLAAAESASFDGPLPDGTASLFSGTALLRAVTCVNGVDDMIDHATVAMSMEPPGSQPRVQAMALLGTGLLLTGLTDVGISVLQEVLGLTEPDRRMSRIIALTELAMAEIDRGELDRAAEYVTQCRALIDQHRLREVAPLASFAVSALLATKAHELDLAAAEIELANRARSRSTYLVPWLALHGRLLLVPAALGIADTETARQALAEARTIVQFRPDLGVLVPRVPETAETVRRWSAAETLGAETLTTAELRLLPMLRTHLSFREVGERLYLSPNTIKTQAMSLYRKLQVSTRSDAVSRARELGLLELDEVEQ